VTFAVGLSAVASAIICKGTFTTDLILPLLAIFLLAAGASALNQYQEWEYDEKMERTRSRPIPSRVLTPSDGTRTAMILMIVGFGILITGGNLLLFGLGALNVFWYNVVYTLQKRRNAFAVIPGALTGAIPLAMGWVAAGGNLSDPILVYLCTFIFIWQMPHFWLITLKYGDEYRKAGFPVLTDIFSPLMMKLSIIAWLLAASAITIYFSRFGISHYLWLRSLLSGISLAVVLFIAWQILIRRQPSFRLIFIIGNLFIFIVFGFLIIDRL
jgi:protoheme IX farnesyltransferase